MDKPEDKVEIEGEVAFPIFSFEATYVDNGKTKTTQNSTMLQAGTTEEMSYENLGKWWHETKAFKKLHISPEAVNSKYIKHEVWYLEWFCHFTYDVGQTDEEVLNSFNKFIVRTPTAELMAAEERWRWHGATDKNSGEQTKAPCRCEACKKQGIVRIGH